MSRVQVTWRAWKMTHDTLLTCPRSVSTSHAFVSGQIPRTSDATRVGAFSKG